MEAWIKRPGIAKGFYPWPRNFHMPWVQPEKKKKIKCRKRGPKSSREPFGGLVKGLTALKRTGKGKEEEM